MKFSLNALDDGRYTDLEAHEIQRFKGGYIPIKNLRMYNIKDNFIKIDPNNDYTYKESNLKFFDKYIDVKRIKPEKLFSLNACKHFFGTFLSKWKICTIKVIT